MDDLFSHYPREVLERFKRFHSDNPKVYQEFKDLATKMKNTGKKRYSARAIFEVIRWERDLSLKTEEIFELNNDFTSIYVRILIHNHPEFRGFFEIRQAKGHGHQNEEIEKGSG